MTTLPAHPLLKTTPTNPREPTQTSLAISGGWAQDESSGKTGGLAVLVEKCFGKPLDKSQQLSDWEKRPLTSEQITYAGKLCVNPCLANWLTSELIVTSSLEGPVSNLGMPKQAL